jgi:tripartite-type tricarboxylate transporter receptor subunit TctC
MVTSAERAVIEKELVPRETLVRQLKMTLRSLMVGVLGLASVTTLVAQEAKAEQWPSKPIILVAPFTPGGTTDMVARTVAQALGKSLQQAVVVDNRPGAGGTVGAASVARGAADGYTLLLTNIGHTAAGALYKKMPYDFEKDFTHVALVAKVPNILVVNKNFPAKNAAEFLSYIKANPGKVHYGSAGVGTTQHLAAELLRDMAKLDVVHVPYKGAAPMMTDLIGGQTEFALDSAGSASTYIRSGRVRALAITSEKRDPSFPDLPTMNESGLPNYVVSTWYGIAAPAGLPEPIKTKLYEALMTAYKDPQFADAYRTIGAEPDTRTPSAFTAYVRTETQRWAGLVKSAGIAAD